VEQLPFILTVCFMLLGPLKIIPAYAALMRSADSRFKREVAVKGALIAFGVCVFVALAGGKLMGTYHISIDALRLSGGLVLLIPALGTIFRRPDAQPQDAGTATAIQLAVSPVAMPMIVPPAGIAFILLFMMLDSQYPGTTEALGICVAIVLVLDFLVMYFIDQIMKAPGLRTLLAVAGSVLVFVQVCISMEMFLTALRHVGVISH
jgi:multiple antibiotic resistance protein